MRTSLYAFAAVAILAVTLPAAAEEFSVRAGDNGVGVRVGNDHHREGWREGRRDHCRTVVVKHRTPDGDMVVRRTRHCD
jgi:uncharacterized protein YcfJ